MCAFVGVCVCTRSCVASVQRVSICGFASMLACLFACVFKLKEEERARGNKREWGMRAKKRG